MPRARSPGGAGLDSSWDLQRGLAVSEGWSATMAVAVGARSSCAL
jgi:hypothetical protein